MLALALASALGCLIAPLVAPTDHFGTTPPRAATADGDWRGQATATAGVYSTGFTGGGGWSPGALPWLVFDADAMGSHKRAGLAPGVWLRLGNKARTNFFGVRLGASGGVGDLVGKAELGETTWYGGSLRLQYASTGPRPGAGFALTGGAGFSEFTGDVPEVYSADISYTDEATGITFQTTDGLLIPATLTWYQLGVHGSLPLDDGPRPITFELGFALEVQIWDFRGWAGTQIAQAYIDEIDFDELSVWPMVSPQLTLGLGF